jgi:hypothetical protein
VSKVIIGGRRSGKTALQEQVDLVVGLSGTLSPAQSAYLRSGGHPRQMRSRHLRALASVVGREYQYLSGRRAEAAQRVLRAVQTELQGRPDRCTECGESVRDDGHELVCPTCAWVESA